MLRHQSSAYLSSATIDQEAFHYDLDDPIDEMRQKLGRLPPNCRPEVVVFSGLSGLLAGPYVAKSLGLRYAIVRKSTEVSHAEYTVEGWLSSRYMFVDDFICSGDTLRRVHEKYSQAYRAATGSKSAPKLYAMFLWSDSSRPAVSTFKPGLSHATLHKALSCPPSSF